MANPEHVDLFKKGPTVWNEWIRDVDHADLSGLLVNSGLANSGTLKDYNFNRTNCRGMIFDGLRVMSLDFGLNQNFSFLKCDFSNVRFEKVLLNYCFFYKCSFDFSDFSNSILLNNNTFSDCSFRGANLKRTGFFSTQFYNCDFHSANLSASDISRCNLIGANLERAKLIFTQAAGSNFSQANLKKANFRYSDLEGASFVDADLTGANFSKSRVFGTSIWSAQLNDCKQNDLIITKKGEPILTTDSLEVAQFVYLMIENSKIRQVIDTIASKVVLILGRFTIKRKKVLDMIKSELRKKNLIPVLFDFDGPETRNLNETVSTIAHMSKFVIADITDPKCIPQELMVIVPQLTSVPVQLVIENSHRPYGMAESIGVRPQVLEIIKYADAADLMSKIPGIIKGCEEKSFELSQLLEKARRTLS